MDSISQIISSRTAKDIDSLYRAEIFIKAIQKKANIAPHNVMDTMYFYLNKKWIG